MTSLLGKKERKNAEMANLLVLFSIKFLPDYVVIKKSLISQIVISVLIKKNVKVFYNMIIWI